MSVNYLGMCSRLVVIGQCMKWQSILLGLLVSVHLADGTRYQEQCLLSASMDKTMIIWKLDSESGVWLDHVSFFIHDSFLKELGAFWTAQHTNFLRFSLVVRIRIRIRISFRMFYFSLSYTDILFLLAQKNKTINSKRHWTLLVIVED